MAKITRIDVQYTKNNLGVIRKWRMFLISICKMQIVTFLTVNDKN